MNAIQTKHNLDFEACPWPRDPSITLFKVGTCHGQYMVNDIGLHLISVINDDPGNGHLEDVFEWFEYSAKTNKLNLFIREFFNDRFKKHCIEKRGYAELGSDNVFKSFTDEKILPLPIDNEQ
jgi:hypothetical protein